MFFPRSTNKTRDNKIAVHNPDQAQTGSRSGPISSQGNTIEQILSLQRTIGNQAVRRMLSQSGLGQFKRRLPTSPVQAGFQIQRSTVCDDEGVCHTEDENQSTADETTTSTDTAATNADPGDSGAAGAPSTNSQESGNGAEGASGAPGTDTSSQQNDTPVSSDSGAAGAGGDSGDRQQGTDSGPGYYPSENEGQGGNSTGGLHTTLDVAGFLPGPPGIIANAANALIYAGEGDYKEAGINALAAGASIVGLEEIVKGGELGIKGEEAIVKGAELGVKGDEAAVKGAELGTKAEEATVKEGEEAEKVAGSGQGGDATSKTSESGGSSAEGIYSEDKQGLVWTEPQTLQEQMMKDKALAGEGNIIMNKFKDPKYQDPGWVKKEIIDYTKDGNKIEMHYMTNQNTGEIDQVKFVSRGEYPKPIADPKPKKR